MQETIAVARQQRQFVVQHDDDRNVVRFERRLDEPEHLLHERIEIEWCERWALLLRAREQAAHALDDELKLRVDDLDAALRVAVVRVVAA